MASVGVRRRSMTLKRKIEIIQEVERNPEKQKKIIAEEYGVAPSTISTILASKERYKSQYFGGEDTATHKKIRSARHDDIEKGLLSWFRYTRSQNVPVSGPFLKAIAEDISRTLGFSDWKCSDGWISRFKKRHNIVFKSVGGRRKGFMGEGSTDAWVKDILRPTLGWYQPADVFSAHQTGLYWRALPNKTLELKADKCSAGNKSKERVTVMVCTDMDGTEKVPLLTVGKFQKPRCFSRAKCIPVEYRANNKAWMDSTLFEHWLSSFDEKMAAEKRKVLLVIDNCPAHPKSTRHLKATELVYLPPNATCDLQPLIQGVIQNLKVRFRKLLLTKLAKHLDRGAHAADFQITLLEALSDLKQAWGLVTASTIKNSFHKAFFTDDEAEEGIRTASDQKEQQLSNSDNASGFPDYLSSVGNSELASERLSEEWNASFLENFSKPAVSEERRLSSSENINTETPSDGMPQEWNISVAENLDTKSPLKDSSNNSPSEYFNIEARLERLLAEWNVSSPDYYSVDQDVATSGPEETATSSTQAAASSLSSDSDYDDCGDGEETVAGDQVLEYVRRAGVFLAHTEGQNEVMEAFYQFREALGRHMAQLDTQEASTQVSTPAVGTEEEKEEEEKEDIVTVKIEVNEEY